MGYLGPGGEWSPPMPDGWTPEDEAAFQATVAGGAPPPGPVPSPFGVGFTPPASPEGMLFPQGPPPMPAGPTPPDMIPSARPADASGLALPGMRRPGAPAQDDEFMRAMGAAPGQKPPGPSVDEALAAPPGKPAQASAPPAQAKPASSPPPAEAAPETEGPPPYTDDERYGEQFGQTALAKRQAIRNQGDIEANAAAVQADRDAEAAAAADNRMQMAERARKAAADETRVELDGLKAEAAALGQEKVNANRVWDDASVPQRIGAIMGLAMGGMLQAFGHRNTAADMITAIIERDIAAQKANIQNKWQGWDSRRGLVAEKAAQGQEDYKAQMSLMLHGLDLAQRAGAAEAAKIRAPGAREKALEQLADLKRAEEGLLAQAQAAREQELWDRKMAEEEMRLKRSANARARRDGQQDAPGAMNPAQDPKALPTVMVVEKDANGRPVTEEVEVNVSPVRGSRNAGSNAVQRDEQGRRVFKDESGKIMTEGVDVFPVQVRDTEGNVVGEKYVQRVPKRTAMRVSTVEDAGKLRGMTAGYRTLDAALADLEYIGSLKGRTLSTKDRADAEAKATQARMAIKNAWQMGALSDDEYQRLVKTIPNPTDIMQWGGEETVRAQRKAFRDTAKSTLGSYGYEVDDEAIYGRGPTRVRDGGSDQLGAAIEEGRDNGWSEFERRQAETGARVRRFLPGGR